MQECEGSLRKNFGMEITEISDAISLLSGVDTEEDHEETVKTDYVEWGGTVHVSLSSFVIITLCLVSMKRWGSGSGP